MLIVTAPYMKRMVLFGLFLVFAVLPAFGEEEDPCSRCGQAFSECTQKANEKFGQCKADAQQTCRTKCDSECGDSTNDCTASCLENCYAASCGTDFDAENESCKKQNADCLQDRNCPPQ